MTQNNNQPPKKTEEPLPEELTHLTPEKQKFLLTLRKTPNITIAARAAGIARAYAYELKQKDPEFSRLWDEYKEEAVEALEAEAERRAFQGVEKPIYQGGKKVGTQIEYSDTLTIFLLKAHKPDKYRERHTVEHSGPDGGVIPVAAAVATAHLRPEDVEGKSADELVKMFLQGKPEGGKPE